MIDLTNIKQVKSLQGSIRIAFDSEQTKNIMPFLEQICGWYDFGATDPNAILMAHGKRQVLATIKTMLKHTPNEVVALAKQQEEGV